MSQSKTMSERRESVPIIQQLLKEMSEIVVDYPKDVIATPSKLEALIDGTACFPAGTGLWRGDCYRGSLPADFPEAPVMFVGHNFDDWESYQNALRAGGEVHNQFWRTLKEFLRESKAVTPEEGFYTNALMGIKVGQAAGQMPDCPGYRPQCQKFLLRQIQIVHPRAVVALGDDAEAHLRRALKLDRSFATPVVRRIMHPSARPLNQRPNRPTWIRTQAATIAELSLHRTSA